MPLAEMERLIVGCQITSEGKWLTTFVVHADEADHARESLLAKLPGATEKEHGGKKYWLADDRAYYLPSGAENNVLVVAPEDAIHDIIDLAGQTPPLRRDIERLIAHTDADRQLTIVFAPNSLFSEGQSIFSGEMARLRDPLFWFLGDELSGAALSMHWDDELLPGTDRNADARNFARKGRPNLRRARAPDSGQARGIRRQSQRAAVWPADRGAVSGDGSQAGDVHAEWLRLGPCGVAMLPASRRRAQFAAGRGTDVGRVAQHARTAAGEAASAAGPAAPTTPATSNDRLTKVTSLKFASDTLESALDQLSQDIGVPIVIRGPDLQADGITKNQSFGIDISNKPAEQILVEILRLANPTKRPPGRTMRGRSSCTSSSKQPDKTEQIVVTTRARAAERHDELPAAFRAEKP